MGPAGLQHFQALQGCRGADVQISCRIVADLMDGLVHVHIVDSRI